MNTTTSEIQIFDVVLTIALALIFARLFGYLFERLKQPPVIGEIFAGLLLGGYGVGVLAGTSFSLFSWTIYIPEFCYTTEIFTFLAELGILFLMFLSGLEINFSDLQRVKKPSVFVAIGGVVAPLIFGLSVCHAFGYSWHISLVVGLILVATSVGVPVRTLMDLRLLNTEVGLTILGSAVIDDVIGIILFVSILGVATPLDVTFLGVKILIFFLLFLFLGFKLVDKVFDLGEKIQLPKALLSLSLAIFLLYSFFAYQSGIAGITGAFVAGLVIRHAIKSRKVIDDIKTLSYGLFIPLFFVWVGANVDLTVFSMLHVLGFALVIIFVAIAGKIIGCGIGAKLAGMSYRRSLQIGIGMIPRLEMALIIVGAAISQGVLTGPLREQILATTVLLTLVTTLTMPFLLKAAFRTRA
ncbi:MAG: cation:proton antiporter [Candidatus Thermoplasmatota archaeon]|nr:cation:proton antiporter [Candidatus Thermoplasmatota archaeon]